MKTVLDAIGNTPLVEIRRIWDADATGIQLARDLPKGSTVAVLLPDRGDRYLSSEVFRSVCSLCPP